MIASQKLSYVRSHSVDNAMTQFTIGIDLNLMAWQIVKTIKLSPI